jgi:hypothetical protein
MTTGRRATEAGRDSAMSREPPSTMIEITPKMIDAGCDALWDSGYGSSTVMSIDVITSIIRAALEAGGFLPKMPLDQSVDRQKDE